MTQVGLEQEGEDHSLHSAQTLKRYKEGRREETLSVLTLQVVQLLDLHEGILELGQYINLNVSFNNFNLTQILEYLLLYIILSFSSFGISCCINHFSGDCSFLSAHYFFIIFLSSSCLYYNFL